MKSPFPGMDPYLEMHWGDVHHTLVQYTRDELQARLPDDLRARVEERVYVEFEEPLRLFIPDVHIAKREPWEPRGWAPETGGDVAIAEPIVIQFSPEVTEGFIEIRERGGGKVVTVIEFLSRTNKTSGAGAGKYRKKQDEVLLSDSSLVEIDLIHGGPPSLAVRPPELPASLSAMCLTCVRRAWERSRFELYKMPLRERLPVIPIPLRKGEPPVPLDLQKLIERAYEAGRYDDIDYTASLNPPLPPEDAEWAEALVKRAGAA